MRTIITASAALALSACAQIDLPCDTKIGGNAAAENAAYFAMGQLPVPFVGTVTSILVEQARFEWRERCAGRMGGPPSRVEVEPQTEQP